MADNDAPEPAQHPTIHELMPRVMAAVGSVGKNRTNTQQGFRFRGIEDVLEKVQPALIAHGVYIVPHAVEVIADQRYRSKGGAEMRNIVCRTTFRAYGPRGDYVTLQALGEGADAGDKTAAKSLSIAQKYALFQAFSIPTEDQAGADPDQEAHERALPEWLTSLQARVEALPDEDAKRKLSQFGRQQKIGPLWQLADESWEVRLTALVDRAEAAVEAAQAPPAADTGTEAGSAQEEGAAPLSGQPDLTPEQQAEVEKIEKRLAEIEEQEKAKAADAG